MESPTTAPQTTAMEDSTPTDNNLEDSVEGEGGLQHGEGWMPESIEDPQPLLDFAESPLVEQIYLLDAVSNGYEKLFLQERLEDAAARTYCGLARKQRLQMRTSGFIEGTNRSVVEEEDSHRNSVWNTNLIFLIVLVVTLLTFLGMVVFM